MIVDYPLHWYLDYLVDASWPVDYWLIVFLGAQLITLVIAGCYVGYEEGGWLLPDCCVQCLIDDLVIVNCFGPWLVVDCLVVPWLIGSCACPWVLLELPLCYLVLVGQLTDCWLLLLQLHSWLLFCWFNLTVWLHCLVDCSCRLRLLIVVSYLVRLRLLRWLQLIAPLPLPLPCPLPLVGLYVGWLTRWFGCCYPWFGWLLIDCCWLQLQLQLLSVGQDPVMPSYTLQFLLMPVTPWLQLIVGLITDVDCHLDYIDTQDPDVPAVGATFICIYPCGWTDLRWLPGWTLLLRWLPLWLLDLDYVVVGWFVTVLPLVTITVTVGFLQLLLVTLLLLIGQLQLIVDCLLRLRTPLPRTLLFDVYALTLCRGYVVGLIYVAFVTLLPLRLLRYIAFLRCYIAVVTLLLLLRLLVDCSFDLLLHGYCTLRYGCCWLRWLIDWLLWLPLLIAVTPVTVTFGRLRCCRGAVDCRFVVTLLPLLFGCYGYPVYVVDCSYIVGWLVRLVTLLIAVVGPCWTRTFDCTDPIRVGWTVVTLPCCSCPSWFRTLHYPLIVHMIVHCWFGLPWTRLPPWTIAQLIAVGYLVGFGPCYCPQLNCSCVPYCWIHYSADPNYPVIWL